LKNEDQCGKGDLIQQDWRTKDNLGEEQILTDRESGSGKRENEFSTSESPSQKPRKNQMPINYRGREKIGNLDA